MTSRLDFGHLATLTTPVGLYEHALHTAPRVEHGYCVDDVARALVVTAREAYPSAIVRRLSAVYLEFLLAALSDDGRMHNRRRPDGTWSDKPSADDHWGRAVWALGVAATGLDDPAMRARARDGVAVAMRARSPWPRSRAYAALGAACLLRSHPRDRLARQLLLDLKVGLGRLSDDPTWPWPQVRLTYANAVLPEAMIATGDCLDDVELRDQGLLLLEWLVEEQTVDGHLSVVAATGRSRNEPLVRFAQQPIEVAVLAEAARTALVVTGDDRWSRVIDRCVAWFDGDNDLAAVMYDRATGGGYDGLEAHGPNRNQGAESTLAWLATTQAQQPVAATSR